MIIFYYIFIFRGVDPPSEEPEDEAAEDVYVEIKDIEKILYGESYNGTLTAKVDLL